MSIDVSLDQLRDTIERYRFAYLLTVTDDGRVHAVAVTPAVTGDGVVISDVGRRSRANAAERPSISLVWPPAEAGDYSLIVDGESSANGNGLTVRPTRAVLHRPAPAGATSPTGCRSDCVPIGDFSTGDA